MKKTRKIMLKDIASFKYGKTIIKKNILEQGDFPVFSGYQVVGYLNDYEFEDEQLIIVCRGVGGTGDIKLSPKYCSITNLAIVIDNNKEKISKKYLYYALKNANTHSMRTGSVQPQITINSLENFQINIVENIEFQKKAVEILDAFDDKIHLNNQINQTLEAIAQAIFKSWFIDFDPVKAKAETIAQGGSQEEAELAAMCTISGKNTEALQHMQTTHPEQYQKLKRTAAAFPSTFVDSELGEIPEGWEVRQVNDFAKIIGGRQLDKSKIKESGNIPVFGGAGIMGYTEKHNAEGFVISIGRVGAYCGQFFSHRGKAYINNNASLIKQKDENLGEWLFISLKNADIEAIKKGAAQPFVSNTDVGNLKLLWGGESMNNYFRFYLNDLYKNMEQRNIESSSLANLRDTLLPELLNGGLS